MRTVVVATVLAALSAPGATRAEDPGAAGTPPSSAEQQQPQQAQPPQQQGQQQPQQAPQADEERRKLEAEIAKELGSAPAGSQPAAPSPPPGGPGAPPAPGAAPQGAPAAQGGSPYARLLLIPDVSAIVDSGLAYDRYDVAARSPRPEFFGPADVPKFFFEELELGFQAVVDPYVRADIFASISPDGANVEEAYATTLSLPAGLQVRAGKFFSPFGRENQQHPHVLEFVDRPLARSRVLAADVLSGPGVDVGWLAPLPWYAEVHLAAQDTTPFPDTAGGPSGGLTGLARLLQYFPFGEATTLGVGLSAARRGEGTGGSFRDLGGADVYLRVRPLETRSYLAVQGEVYARKLRGAAADADRATRTGFWTQAFWRQDAYLGYGVRYEEAPGAVGSTVGGALGGTERRVSGVATWFPSEFQRLRLQVGWDRPPGGRGGLEALVHLEFGIGAHGAHPF